MSSAAAVAVAPAVTAMSAVPGVPSLSPPLPPPPALPRAWPGGGWVAVGLGGAFVRLQVARLSTQRAVDLLEQSKSKGFKVWGAGLSAVVVFNHDVKVLRQLDDSKTDPMTLVGPCEAE